MALSQDKKINGRLKKKLGVIFVIFIYGAFIAVAYLLGGFHLIYGYL